jgi:hypothetical protein
VSGLSRRSFLGGALAGGALAGASTLLPGSARASGSLTLTPAFGGPYKILEIYLNGGADLWMHAYQVAWAKYATWLGHSASTSGLDYITSTDWSTAFAVSGGGSPPHPTWVPAHPTDHITFGTDAASQAVRWGAALKPLWMTGLQYSTRMIMVGHGFFPHEGGIPLALTGTSFGRPIACGLGAPLNRVRAAGSPPVSWVLPVRAAGIGALTVQSAAATGFHGAQNQPVVIAVGDNSIFGRIARGTPAGSTVARAAGDPLRTLYKDSYRSMLNHGGRARSRAYDAYEGSLLTMEGYAGVSSQIAGLSFATPASPDVYNNGVSTAIKAAFGLFAAAARHVTVVDTDWDTHSNGGTYTASDYAINNTRKVYAIAHAIAHAAATGAFNPADTMIYIHSEFGRYHEGSNGTQHGPRAYPVMLIGGPVNTAASPSNPLVGTALDLSSSSIINDPNATDLDYSGDTYGITDVRAAVALAAGIDPWNSDMYVESDDWLGNVVAAAGGSTSASNYTLQTDILGA